MLRLCSKVTIINEAKEVLTFDYIKEVKATTSWDTLVDSAKVTLPKKVYVQKDNTPKVISLEERVIASTDSTNRSENSKEPLFKVKDRIKIELGYDYKFNLVFEGLIKSISATVPIELECVDPLWLLDRIKLEEEVVAEPDKNPTQLSALIKALEGKFNSDVDVKKYLELIDEEKKIVFEAKVPDNVDLPLSNFSVKGKTIGTVLEKLKNEYHVYTFYKNVVNTETGKVIGRSVSFGNYYPDFDKLESTTDKKFNFQNSIISEELVDSKEEDKKINIQLTNVEAQGAAPSDKAPQVIVGSKDKEAKTIFLKFFKFKDKAKDLLEGIAQRKLKTIRYNGYSGHILTFGKPFVKHGDTIELVDDYVKERNGMFKVKQVDYSFGENGFKQKIHLHLRVDEKA